MEDRSDSKESRNDLSKEEILQRKKQLQAKNEEWQRQDNEEEEVQAAIVGTFKVKAGMAKMLKGGVIMDVVNAAQARIAEEAGACAVMALERVPADIRKDGGVARMSDPQMIKAIKKAVTIPVMAKARIGHFVEAQILQAIECDYIDESEVLTIADEKHHIDKHKFTIPFVCGARNLGEALRRISEGAAMIRTKGEAGTGNVWQAVHHARTINDAIRLLKTMEDCELYTYAKEICAPIDLVKKTKKAWAATCRQLCCRWYCNSSRCCLDDAIGNGWSFRRLWNLQIRKPSKKGESHCSSSDTLRRSEDIG